MIRLLFGDLLVISLCKAHLLTLGHLLLANLVDYKLKVVVFAALLTLAFVMLVRHLGSCIHGRNCSGKVALQPLLGDGARLT